MSLPTIDVLTIDDELSMQEIYRDILSREGYSVEQASTAKEALDRIAQSNFDAVILDQRLNGPGGDDSGLTLLSQMLRHNPSLKIIIATAYSSPEAVQQAFRSGVHDYLEKQRLSVFKALLQIKIRSLVEMGRKERLRIEPDAMKDARLHELWQSVKHETNSQRKGKQLEELVPLLFEPLRELKFLRVNATNEQEEIDVLFRNDGMTSFWHGLGAVVLVECKHRATPTGVSDLHALSGKMRNRYGLAKLGIFVSMKGFASTIKTDLLTYRQSGQWIVTVDSDQIEKWLNLSRDKRGAELESYLAAKIVEP